VGSSHYNSDISLAEHSRSSFVLIVFLSAGDKMLPLSGNADEGCQWEVQTNEGWTLYWDPQA
jgi:hypothetical protein